MIYPSIDKLLNIVDSKYELVHIAARRSKEISRTGHYQMSEGEYKCKKNIYCKIWWMAITVRLSSYA